jgi:hypothetical protein
MVGNCCGVILLIGRLRRPPEIWIRKARRGWIPAFIGHLRGDAAGAIPDYGTGKAQGLLD